MNFVLPLARDKLEALALGFDMGPEVSIDRTFGSQFFAVWRTIGQSAAVAANPIAQRYRG
jgi:hypothetical protein